LNLRQALSYAQGVLTASNIEDAHLEAEVLLRHTQGISRAQLYMEPDGQISPSNEEAFRGMVERRRRGEPSAYITGHREFYGLEFQVDSRVLIPRPETELLVEKAISLSKSMQFWKIADTGTGCGVIAICLAKSLPSAKIYATDISAPALEVASLNCQKHRVTERVVLLKGDMLEPLPERVHLIAANLPYVTESELPDNGPLSFEPRGALDGGPEGLKYIERLCRQCGGKLLPGGGILLEVGLGQAEAVKGLLNEIFPGARVEKFKDFNGIERVVQATIS
jgi:release factor glutamine methyltransferase